MTKNIIEQWAACWYRVFNLNDFVSCQLLESKLWQITRPGIII